MSIVKDAQIGTAGTLNPIVNNALDRLDVSVAAVVAQLGPKGAALATEFQAAALGIVKAMMDGAGAIGDKVVAEIPKIERDTLDIFTEYELVVGMRKREK